MSNKLSKKRKEEIMKQFGSRMPTKEEVFEKIRASQERMMEALKGAYETAPDDPNVRKDLVNVIEKATKMRSKLYKEVLKETPPKLKNK